MVSTDDTDALSTLFEPESIALVGASDDPEKLSGRPFRYLRKFGYRGDVFLVNPSHDEIDGEPCYDSVTDVPHPVDVAVVLVPARVVPTVIEECGRHGVDYAVVIASGFGETGPDGERREADLVETAREHGVRLVGPNSQGLVTLDAGVAASFSSMLERDDLQSGNVGLVSQSGAFGGAVFQLLQNAGVGANKWITTGNEADLDALDVLAHYVEDPEIDVVAAYLESVDRGRRLLEIGRRATATDTDIVAMRVGTSAEGERATESHTGSIATDDAVYDAVMDQAGITRVCRVDEFSDVVGAFARLPAAEYPTPEEGIGVLSVSGGAAALIADTCDRVGVPLATLAESTREAIGERIPSYGSATNPVDVTGTVISDPAVFHECVTAMAADDAVGMLLLQYGNSGAETIEVCKETVIDVRTEYGVPTAAVFTGSTPRVSTASELLEAGVLPFEDPVSAVETFGAMYESGCRTSGEPLPALPADRRPFPESDWAGAQRALSEIGVEFAPSVTVSDERGAVQAAADVGYPVALKLDPLAVPHKSDLGGVEVGLGDESAVRQAYRNLAALDVDADVVVQRMVEGVELVVGVVDDSDFGPVMLFGPGGVFVELFDDAVSYRALPVDETDARTLVENSAASRLLDGYRDVPPADTDAVAATLSAVSDAYLEYDVTELELNPLVATPEGCVAVDLLVE